MQHLRLEPVTQEKQTTSSPSGARVVNLPCLVPFSQPDRNRSGAASAVRSGMTSAIASNITPTVIRSRLVPRTGGLTAVGRALAATVAMTLGLLAAFGAFGLLTVTVAALSALRDDRDRNFSCRAGYLAAPRPRPDGADSALTCTPDAVVRGRIGPARLPRHSGHHGGELIGLADQPGLQVGFAFQGGHPDRGPMALSLRAL
ncbi:MAG: hypothetical protein QOD34_261 [Mycobacterium sp.]|nr:hypothetical protein [Mycobacterium sp.]